MHSRIVLLALLPSPSPPTVGLPVISGGRRAIRSSAASPKPVGQAKGHIHPPHPWLSTSTSHAGSRSAAALTTRRCSRCSRSRDRIGACRDNGLQTLRLGSLSWPRETSESTTPEEINPRHALRSRPDGEDWHHPTYTCGRIQHGLANCEPTTQLSAHR